MFIDGEALVIDGAALLIGGEALFIDEGYMIRQDEVKATYPVVPDRNRVRLPVEARLEVGVLGELVEEELEDGVRLRLRDADDAAGEA